MSSSTSMNLSLATCECEDKLEAKATTVKRRAPMRRWPTPRCKRRPRADIPTRDVGGKGKSKRKEDQRAPAWHPSHGRAWLPTWTGPGSRMVEHLPPTTGKLDAPTIPERMTAVACAVVQEHARTHPAHRCMPVSFWGPKWLFFSVTSPLLLLLWLRLRAVTPLVIPSSGPRLNL